MDRSEGRMTLLAVMVVVVVLVAGWGVEAQIPKAGCATLFEGCEYKGEYLEVCENVQSLIRHVPSFNDRASSVLFGGQVAVRLFDNSNFLGSGVEVGRASVECIAQTSYGWLDNRVSGIKVEAAGGPAPGCVRLYDECHYQGEYLEVCENVQSLIRHVPSFNDRTSSVLFGPEVRVTLFDNSNFLGSGIPLAESVECIAQTSHGWLDNRVSGIKVVRV